MSITFDIGHSPNGNNYLTVLCHWMDHNWNMQKCIIGYQFIDSKYTGEYMASIVLEIVLFYGLFEKVLTFTLYVKIGLVLYGQSV